MNKVAEEKRAAMLQLKTREPRETLGTLKQAMSTAQKTARRYANSYWLEQCERVQQAADVVSIHCMYDRTKKAIGPTNRSTAPLKTAAGGPLTGASEQMSRWVEHYSYPYGQEQQVTGAGLGSVDPTGYGRS